jgi:hypothetical protein
MFLNAQLSLCPLCDADLATSESAEHILQNAIGGRLKTRGFICDGCNHRTGREWDSVAADQLNFWCLFFGIKRQRGEAPEELIETTAGEELLMQPRGGFRLSKPIHSQHKTDAGTQIAITARTWGEARRICLRRQNACASPRAQLSPGDLLTDGLLRYSDHHDPNDG